MKPQVAILRTDGINCDEELYFAFEKAGGAPVMVHINELRSRKKRLSSFQILAIPGGFSYGDDILSGKVLANELTSQLDEEINKFVSKDKLVLGVCNGFQVLVRTGLLPWNMKPSEDVGLVYNKKGVFQCHWIKLKIQKSDCVFTQGLIGKIYDLPVAHGEGMFIVKNEKVARKLSKNNHVVVRYVDDFGETTKKYPYNPNGSYEAVAGITDETGKIFGLMPHPERNILPHHHPDFHSDGFRHTSCLSFFKNAVDYYTA